MRPSCVHPSQHAVVREGRFTLKLSTQTDLTHAHGRWPHGFVNRRLWVRLPPSAPRLDRSPPRLEDHRVMPVPRRALTLCASATLSLALAGSATASVARNDLPAWACDPHDIATAAAGVGAEARAGADGLARDRESGQDFRDAPQAPAGLAPANFSVTVP